MAIFLNDSEVTSLVSTVECIDILDNLFRQEAQGKAENLARRRMPVGRGVMVEMGGVVFGSGVAGVRFRDGSGKNLTTIIEVESGTIQGVLDTSTLGAIRTGAATGLATKYLALPEASTIGLIGVGSQASYQLEAVCAIRTIHKVKVFSRTRESRETFARQMADRLGLVVDAVSTAEDAVRGSQVVIAITNSSTPVFDGNSLDLGTHVNAVGSNSWRRREIDNTTIERSELIVVDNLDQARIECGELLFAAEQGSFRWTQAVEMKHVVAGHFTRPSAEAITLFESQGLGLEDVACCAVVLRKAREKDMGTQLPY